MAGGCEPTEEDLREIQAAERELEHAMIDYESAEEQLYWECDADTESTACKAAKQIHRSATAEVQTALKEVQAQRVMTCL